MARILASILLAVMLVACGGTSANPSNPSNPNNPPGGTAKIKQFGYVSLAETTTQGITVRGGVGSFTGYAQAIDVPKNPFFLETDTCAVFVQQDVSPPPTPTAPEGTSLDAGDALTLNPGATPYATLPRRVFQEGITYLSDFNTPLLPFPSSLVLDVPGAASGFPEFKGIAFPGIPGEFTLTQPTNPSTITKATTFAWTGTASSDSVMQFYGSGSRTDGKLVGFSCVARDDGSFSFPTQTQSELDANGFTTGSLTLASRLSIKQEIKGEAALFISIGRSQSFLEVTP